MKILRFKNGIEKKMPFDFNVRGLGILYENTTYKGTSGDSYGDTFDLKLGENYIITKVPMTAVDRIGVHGEGPLGFKYSWPVIFKRGEKITFDCRNSNIGEEHAQLIMYGLPVADKASLKNKIQKKPDRIIRLRGFPMPHDFNTAEETSLEMSFDKTIHLLSLGFLYAEKLTGLAKMRFQNMPDSVKGYFQVVGHLYYIFDDKSRPLNLISDMYRGYLSRTKDYNAKKIELPENDLLTLQLSTAMVSTGTEQNPGDGDQNLSVVIEYSDHWKTAKKKK